MKLSVVIPARNEEGHLDSTLEGLVTRLDRDSIRDFEIIVVDDGSTDQTWEILTQWTNKDPRIRPVVNDGRHGYGRAVRHGLDAVTGDAVVITMADASDDPGDIVA